MLARAWSQKLPSARWPFWSSWQKDCKASALSVTASAVESGTASSDGTDSGWASSVFSVSSGSSGTPGASDSSGPSRFGTSATCSLRNSIFCVFSRISRQSGISTSAFFTATAKRSSAVRTSPFDEKRKSPFSSGWVKAT